MKLPQVYEATMRVIGRLHSALKLTQRVCVLPLSVVYDREKCSFFEGVARVPLLFDDVGVSSII